MTIPYKARIVCQIGGDVFELARFKRNVSSYDIRFCTRNISSPWRIERPMRDDETITARWNPQSGRFSRWYNMGKVKVIKRA